MKVNKAPTLDHRDGLEVAIIGMSGRFPGAKDVEEFWRNVRDGIESISFFTDQELKTSGIDPVLLSNPDYVKARGVLEDPDLFDASFFGFTPREAETTDPQQRLFLECAWEALESAGYNPERYGGLIGVYAGVGPNAYFLNNLYPNRDLMEAMGDFQALIGNDKDYVTTRVSYKMNLRGPSVVVQTACSTSLVAVCQACQSLLSGECDIALAGASSICIPQKQGYLYQNGGITSPDGHCRAFDAKAQGTVLSSAVGIVVLKRLEEALADGDCIHAVIKGSAINNDGSFKAGYTAPSVDGQAKVIKAAHIMAETQPETITYIETHGTATPLGDPIEIAGLTQAFRTGTQMKGFCAIGSVKTNIGHTDTAAGVAGLIKSIFMLKNKRIPPSLHFEKPNPEIDLESSPFFVNTALREWRRGQTPLRAGVSSFGIGGTNAHVIVEEAPDVKPSSPSRPKQLILLSGKTSSALESITTNLVKYLTQHPDLNLADVAYTLQTGRKTLNHRRLVVCGDPQDAATTLEALDSTRVLTSFQEPMTRDIVFMFSGQGSQYVNMGLELYRTESGFQELIDQCSEILQPQLSLDLRNILYPEEKNGEEAAKVLKQTFITQPALFTIEYALAKLWMSWGIIPNALIGHSIGEYVAACLSGVFSLEDALLLVAARGRLMQQMPTGSMLAVHLSEKDIQRFLGQNLSVAAVNAPTFCVVSGETEAVRRLENELEKSNVVSTLLHTSHAFHSNTMEPILDAFAEQVGRVRANPPQIPFVSNLTGKWITPEEAMSPRYWAKHLRQTVRFSDGVQELLKEPNRVLLEVGPGQTLSTLVRQHANGSKDRIVLSSVRHPKEERSDIAFILSTLGRLWLAGVKVDWSGFYRDERRHRLPLPTYPFERQRYWVEAQQTTQKVIVLGTLRETEQVEKDEVLSYAKLDLKASPKADKANIESKTLRIIAQNQLEAQLANIWKKLLGIEPIGIHDNFFELGGNSLLALRLLAQVEKIFGRKIPLATFFQAPSIEQLASILDQKNGFVSHDSLVLVQKGAFKPPLFCIPGNLGNVFTDLGYLAKHLGPDQPVYGLQDGVKNPSRVEALAAKYIDAIRGVQRNGPYFLAGVCSGGTIAFEMANRLLSEGEKVSLLALIEPPPPRSSCWSVPAFVISRLTRRLQHNSRSQSQISGGEHMAYLLLKLKLIANVWALSRYAPRPYPGCMHLFLTAETQATQYSLPWRELALGGAEVCTIPGTHSEITGDGRKVEEAYMQTLAEKLRHCIDFTRSTK